MLMRPAQWAQSQFSSAKLGDRRRTQRLVKIATNLAQSPGGTLPQAFPVWSELKAAYRFFEQPKITFEEIQRPHWQQTRAACHQPGQYLMIEDTSLLDFTDHPATEELGPIGDGRGRGLLLHTTLALRIEGWDLQERPRVIALGLLAQRCWSRWLQPNRRGETRRQLMSRSRESQRWALALEEGGPPAGSTWIYVADRESDFYEPIERCQRQGADFVIRGFHDRVLSQGEGHLQVKMAQAPVLGRLDLEVRARAGRAARTAQLEVRAMSVNLNGPRRLNGKQPDFQLNVVEVREADAPPRGRATALAAVDFPAVRHLETSAAGDRHLHPALVRGRISQSAQERSRGRGQPDGESLPHRIARGSIGHSGRAAVQYQVAGANASGRAGRSKSFWSRVAGAPGSAIWQTQRRLDSPHGVGIGGQSRRIHSTAQRWNARLAKYLARLEPTQVDGSWIRNLKK